MEFIFDLLMQKSYTLNVIKKRLFCIYLLFMCWLSGYSDGAGVQRGHRHPYDDETPAVLLEVGPHHRGPDEPGQFGFKKTVVGKDCVAARMSGHPAGFNPHLCCLPVGTPEQDSKTPACSLKTFYLYSL